MATLAIIPTSEWQLSLHLVQGNLSPKAGVVLLGLEFNYLEELMLIS